MLKWNIRNQILSVGVLSVLVLAGVIVYFYNFTEDRFRANSQDIISLTNEQFADELSGLLNNRGKTFASWIGDDVFGLAIEFQTTAELKNEFDTWMADSSGFSCISLVDKDGTIIVVAQTGGEGNRILIPGQSLPDYPALDASGKDHIFFLESPAVNSGTQKGTYIFYHPTMSSMGERNGALVAYMNWTDIDDAIVKGADKLAGLEFEGTNVLLIYPADKFIQSYNTALDPKASSDLFSWVNSHRSEHFGQTDIANASHFIGLRAVAPPSLDTNADTAIPYVVTLIDENAVMSGLMALLVKIIIFGIIGSVLAMIASYYIAMRISRRVSAVSDVASRMSRGDIDIAIDIRSKDEIGTLASSFMQLADYIKNMAAAAERISRQDLTVRVVPISDKDVLGISFQTMIDNLTGLIGELKVNITNLVSAATEISATSEQMASGAKQQTLQTTQVATAIEEMSATIVQSSQNANEAKMSAEKTAEVSTDGQRVVGETINGLVKITNAANQSRQIIHDLAQASARIGEIISVIDDIADQTNLLALNAAIEAARAGEQGRGFAVVADEVRKLAERTGKATGEITEMIKGIQNNSELAVQSMEGAGSLVEEGKEQADKAGISLNEISAMAQTVKDMIVQIATAADEQSAAAEEISRNVEQISQVTDQTAQGAQQSASAATELNTQAEKLETMVSRFTMAEK